jgi:hypothetical protein
VGQMFKQKINTAGELVEWSHWIPNDHARLSWVFDTVSHTWTDTWEKSGVQQSSPSAFPTSVLRSAPTFRVTICILIFLIYYLLFMTS